MGGRLLLHFYYGYFKRRVSNGTKDHPTRVGGSHNLQEGDSSWGNKLPRKSRVLRLSQAKRPLSGLVYFTVRGEGVESCKPTIFKGGATPYNIDS